MNQTQYYLDVIKRGIHNHEEIIQVPAVQDMDALMPIFEAGLSYPEFIHLNGILHQRYALHEPGKPVYYGHFERDGANEDIREINLVCDKSEVIDLSKFHRLKRIKIVGARLAKRLVLPQNGCVNALTLGALGKLEAIENIAVQPNLRFFYLSYASKISDFSFIGQLNSLVYLGFCKCKNLGVPHFIPAQVRMLELSETDAFKFKETFEVLARMKHLKCLITIAESKANRRLIAARLPHVAVRE